jgi:cold shock CspA family protein
MNSQVLHVGVVHFWDEQKGMGFIRRKEGGPDVFFHFSELPQELTKNRRRSIAPNTIVEFTVGEFRGKVVARDVRPLMAVEPDGGNDEHGN